MNDIFRQTQLYRFLQLCNEKCSGKKVLDCGAGGSQPPLSLFSEYGYDTFGIDNDEKQIDMALSYAKSKNQTLKLTKSDMKDLPFNDGEFDSVYSYNSIFHMQKHDIEKTLMEMMRVLKTGGLLFVNFLSTDDDMCGKGSAVGTNEFEQNEDGPVIHAYYEHNEADRYFENMELLFKEIRTVHRVFEEKFIKQGFIDYILQKK